jgi:hypothetical protein
MTELPELLTEEEAERKAAMIKAAREVAEAVNEMKINLESLGWSMAEQASLTLFNTMMMTSFSKSFEEREKTVQKKVEDIKVRIQERAIELAEKRGFGATNESREVVNTCITMLLAGRDENQVGAVWEDFYGEGTKGVLCAVLIKARDEVQAEVQKEEESQ